MPSRRRNRATAAAADDTPLFVRVPTAENGPECKTAEVKPSSVLYDAFNRLYHDEMEEEVEEVPRDYPRVLVCPYLAYETISLALAMTDRFGFGGDPDAVVHFVKQCRGERDDITHFAAVAAVREMAWTLEASDAWNEFLCTIVIAFTPEEPPQSLAVCVILLVVKMQPDLCDAWVNLKLLPHLKRYPEKCLQAEELWTIVPELAPQLLHTVLLENFAPPPYAPSDPNPAGVGESQLEEQDRR